MKREETQMKAINKTVTRNHTSAPLALVAFLAVMAPGADAKHRVPTSAEQPVTIVAHVPLSGSPTNQMDLQENDVNKFHFNRSISNFLECFAECHDAPE